MPERAKILARAGVVAEQVKAKQRPTKDLKQRIRDTAERTIMQISLVSEKEFIQPDDLDMLSRLNRLLDELDRQEASKLSDLTDEELAKQAK